MVTEGKRIRLGHIFGESGRAMVLPVDHGLSLGRVAGLEEPWSLIKEAVAVGCDGVLVSLGVARATAEQFARREAPARLLALDTVHSADGEERGRASIVAAVGQAAGLACAAVKLLMPWDVPAAERSATVERIGRVIELAEPWGMPVMVEPIAMYRTRDRVAIDMEIDAARIAMELGADVIKMSYPGDRAAMSSACEELGVPVMILGGPHGTTAEALITIVEEALSAGAAGIVIGRNVWQRPVALRRHLLRALVAMVHGELSGAGALKELEGLSG